MDHFIIDCMDSIDEREDKAISTGKELSASESVEIFFEKLVNCYID